MLHIKFSSLCLVIFFTCLGCKNNETDPIKTVLPKSDNLNLQSNISTKTIKTPEVIYNETEPYYFNKVLKKQMFDLNYEKSAIEEEFKNIKVEFKNNFLNYNKCQTEIRFKNEKTNKYLNGIQNVQIYNEILSEANLFLADEIEYAILLNIENNCNLPAENFLLIDKSNLAFVYRGYLVLFSKTYNPSKVENKAQKIVCAAQSGNMEVGYTTTCIINENFKIAYDIFIEESTINEIKYLKKVCPLSDTSYSIDNEVEIFYKYKNGNLSIELLFQGGETFITFGKYENKTKIKIENFPQ